MRITFNTPPGAVATGMGSRVLALDFPTLTGQAELGPVDAGHVASCQYNRAEQLGASLVPKESPRTFRVLGQKALFILAQSRLLPARPIACLIDQIGSPVGIQFHARLGDFRHVRVRGGQQHPDRQDHDHDQDLLRARTPSLRHGGLSFRLYGLLAALLSRMIHSCNFSRHAAGGSLSSSNPLSGGGGGGFSQFWNRRRNGKFNSSPISTITARATGKRMNPDHSW